MPTYTHKCARCGHEFDLFCSMKDRDTKKPCRELGDGPIAERCDLEGELERPHDIVDLTAFTPYGWKP